MRKEKILITGSNGTLGGSLIGEILHNTDYDVISVASSVKKIQDMMEREGISSKERVISVNNDGFINGEIDNIQIDSAIHLAFSRAKNSAESIAESIEFTSKVFRKLHKIKVPRIIYMSSQSVYGNISEWRHEELSPAPEISYAMAKYAGEKLLEMQFGDLENTQFTSLRLDYVIQSQNLVPVLCRSAKERGKIILQGGKQTFSYIDKSEVAKAIVALLNYGGPWKRIYNVGHNHMRYSLKEVADVVACVAGYNGVNKVDISLEENDTILWSGMDSSRFMNDTGWRSSMDLYQMVENIYITI